nr:KfrB domain-containing protein [Klebsiella pneumoniae]
MPEGSRKVCVLNGSRQLDQVVKGEWMTIKVLPENGLPKGIYQLAEATKPDTGKDGKESAYTGQVLHVDSKAVGTVAKLAMRQPFVLFKGLTFQKLCLPGAFRPGDHHNKMLRPGLCVVHASPQYL